MFLTIEIISIKIKKTTNFITNFIIFHLKIATIFFSVINFTTLSGNNEDKKTVIDTFLSGNYLVTEVRHLAQTTPQGIHTMTLTCAKDSVGVEYIPNDKEVLNKDMILAKGNDFNQFDIEEV